MIAIIGLGNPGEHYKETRHNIGWLVINMLQNKWDFPQFRNNTKFNAFISKGSMKGVDVLLVKPTTFMNESGDAVKKISSYFKIPAEHIYIIHDELDLPFGSFKISIKRGAAGHNGIQSILEQLGKNVFYRWRIGINNKAARPGDSRSFVLKQFSFLERRKMTKLFEKIKQSIEQALSSSPENAMTETNKRV